MNDSQLKLECLKLAEGDMDKALSYYSFCKEQEKSKKDYSYPGYDVIFNEYKDIFKNAMNFESTQTSSRWYNTNTKVDVPVLTNKEAKEHVIDNHAFADNTTKNQY